MELLLGAAGDVDALVLDPFAGSGTTGEAVMRLNAQDGGVRRFILIEEGEPNDRYCRTVTAPRLSAAITKDGYAAGFDFFAPSSPAAAILLRAGPSASGGTMSKRNEGTPALAKCAAMRAPIVPAPRMATR